MIRHSLHIMLVIGFITLGSSVATLIVSLMRQGSMIYRTPNLPPFKLQQDLTTKPYLPLVRLETESGEFFCSGTVISDDYVLTAAHCLVTESMFSTDMTRAPINIVSLKNVLTGEILTVKATAAAVNRRADTALVKGDFSQFTKLQVDGTPSAMYTTGPILTCGFPWGSREVCYPTGSTSNMFFERVMLQGILFPGMSGGPVIDVNTKRIVAINSAIGQGFIVIAPTVGLFDALGVQVIE